MRFREIVASPATWYILSIFAWFLHAYWARDTNTCHPLARVGALIILFGAAVAARPIIRKGYKKWLHSNFGFDGGSIFPTPEEEQEFRQRELDIVAVQILGPLLIFVGTLEWGYGDLLCKAIWPNSN